MDDGHCSLLHMPWRIVDECLYIMLVFSFVSWWFWMFVVATAGPVAPRLTMHINVFLKDTDSQSNQKAFSQDSLFRGYAREKKKKKKAQTLAVLSASLWQPATWQQHEITWVFCFRLGCRLLLFFKCPLFLINVPHLPSCQVPIEFPLP